MVFLIKARVLTSVLTDHFSDDDDDDDDDLSLSLSLSLCGVIADPTVVWIQLQKDI